MPIKRLLFLFLTIVICILSFFTYQNREPLYLNYLATKIEKKPLAELQEFLAPNIHVRKPPLHLDRYPVVIQFHGCAGHRDLFMDYWAKAALSEGYMAVSVDSNGPRGFDREKSLEVICEGKALLGQERAGDVVAAIDLVSQRADVDPSRIVVAGWSHGAWSIMDMLAMGLQKHVPANLDDKNIALPSLAGAILFYPYCGEGSWSRIKHWSQTPPTLALIAGQDTIVDGPECVDQMNALNAKGAKIRTVLYESVDHVFDDPTKPGGTSDFYDETAAQDSIKQYRDFLRDLAPPLK